MKPKAFFCVVLAMAAVVCGGSAIATSRQTVEAADFEKTSYNKASIDRLSTDAPFIDFSQLDKSAIEFDSSDSSGLDIFIPIRPDFSFGDEEEQEPMPEQYCMRDEYVMYAQHQDKEGYCWNFAATMSASTTIMRQTNEYYDFSEAWNGLACLYTGNSYNKIGAGGHFSYQYDAIQYGGLMLETDFPYQYTYTISGENADSYYNFFKQYSNDNLVDCLKNKSFSKNKVEDIKRHVYNHGSVYASFSFRSSHTPDENGIYSIMPNQKNCNSAHAVSIIGWDDNYEREFILDGSDTPTLFKGAWIVLNSFMEKNGNDGVFFVFYDDANLYGINGYTYQQKTNKDLYFYDKIEEGYAYPNNVKGKYYGEFKAQTGESKQKNIFYDDVSLGYSYIISEGASIQDISIYLDNVDITKDFNVRIDSENKRFYIEKEGARYGQYKVLVTYGNGRKADTYLNNFFVTYGLLGEKLELDTEANALAFNSGRDLEYYSVIRANKEYVIYTNQRSGGLSFLPIAQSIYSDKNMSIPTLTYDMGAGDTYTATHTITSTSGYALNYNFHFEYYEDTTLQPVNVYYDLNGGVNHPLNYDKELASETSDLTLYTPTREGYVFDGWYLDFGGSIEKLTKKGDAYYLDWEKIHHMGEAPTLYASAYYTKYYNNTNVAFVCASWVKAEYYNVETEIVGGGTATPSGDTTITSYDVLTYTFTPNEGYIIKDVKVNGVSVGAVTSYTFTDVCSAQTLCVEFESIKNEIVVSVEGKGSVTTDGEALKDVPYGESRTLILSADEGWRVANVYVNGERVNVVDNRLLFENVKEGAYVVVVFEKTQSNVVFLATVIPLSAVAVIASVLLIVQRIRGRKRKVFDIILDFTPKKK